jgi:1,4-dihydroxy-2-naphthoate polyprenyltransferase
MEAIITDRRVLLGTIRVPFLILAPCCVLVGLGTAVWTTGQANILQFLLMLIGAVAGHISVNAFNEYFDFRSGLDAKTVRTPFSGGSGTLQARPDMARQALALAAGALLVTALIGAYFVVARGIGILPLWALGLALAVLYTPLIVHNPALCLIAPGLGFGTVMVVSTHFALTGSYSAVALVASLVPFFLVSNLLLLNQFPDVEADRSTGRRHYPIVIGRKSSSVIYGAFLLATYLAIALGVVAHYLPLPALLGLLTAPLAWQAGRGAYQNADNMAQLVPSMGLNVIINLATPVLLAIGLMMG